MWENGEMPYNKIVESNEKIDRLIESSDYMCREIERVGNNINGNLNRIYENTNLTAYFTEQTAKQLEYQNRMNYYYGEFKNAGYLNAPPTVEKYR